MTLPTPPRPPEDEHDWLSADYVEGWVADWSNRAERPEELRRVAAALPIERSAAIGVLDVGGGWGPLTEAVLGYRPQATVTLVDFSPPMLEHARRHLAPFGDRARLEQRDLVDPLWREDLGGPFNAVVSSLAIHNLRDPDIIARVYADIVELLTPRSWFFNLEIVFPAGTALALVAQRLRALDEDGDPDEFLARPANASGVSFAADERTESAGPGAPPPLSLEHQLALLRGAGFQDVDCLWRDGVVALLAARTL